MLLLLPVIFELSIASGYTQPATNEYYGNLLKNVNCSCNKSSDLDVSEIKLSVSNFETGTLNYVPLNEGIDIITNSTDFNESQCIQIYVTGFGNASVLDAECAMSKMTCDNGMKPIGIIADYSAYTGRSIILDSIAIMAFYERATKYSKSIGVQLGYFLASLLKKVDKGIVDLFGLSLGAHIVGYMADTVYNEIGVKLPRIYGSDPAGPCFDECPAESLKSGQADTVVCYHCNSNQLGTSLRICDYDIISYDGLNQQNCGSGSTELGVSAYDSFCSHCTCLSVLTEPSLSNEEGAGIWEAKRCSSTEAYLSGACDDNETMLTGYRVDPTGPPGLYYVTPYTNLTCYKGVLPLLFS